jgi:NADP-dependent 3-hydroxy acid dehydrogenase YdfG
MQSETEGIAGKVVVITGASSGLGEATARRLSAHGATVVLGARRAARIEALAAEIAKAGGKAIAVATDVTDAAQVQRLVDAAVEQFGRIDVMLNNAGLMPHSPLERRKIADWDRTIDVNIKGVLYGIAAALPYMQKQNGGHFINVTSVAGHKVRPAGAVYLATKMAVRVISEGLRQEVKPWNIRTTIIRPERWRRICRRASRSRTSRRAWVTSMRSTPSLRTLARRRVRDEPTRGRGHQRDPVPADEAGGMSLAFIAWCAAVASCGVGGQREGGKPNAGSAPAGGRHRRRHPGTSSVCRLQSSRSYRGMTAVSRRPCG